MPEREPKAGRAQEPALPAELEARIAALEAEPSRADFEWRDWFWMTFLGIAVPVILLIIGWRV